MHWIRPWPKNKSCYPSQVLQLLFRSHSHANTLSYCSTLVKLASWKWHFKWNQHLEANLAYVMNINIVPFTILDVSKVFSWPHNHLIHWSYMIASINTYINQHFMWQCIRMRWNFICSCSWMLGWCLCSWNASANAMLNTGVLQHLPLIGISSWDLKDLPFLIKSRINLT